MDASKRDVCSVKRERTASPLQALVLLNDPQMVEAARVLGEKLARDHGDDVDGIVGAAFRQLVGRQASAEELAVLAKLYREQYSVFEAAPEKAQALLKTGDSRMDEKLPAAKVAACAMVVNALLNFDGSVMKR